MDAEEQVIKARYGITRWQGNKQNEWMDVNDRGRERVKGGEKRDSALGQSQPPARHDMAQHATHQQNAK